MRPLRRPVQCAKQAALHQSGYSGRYQSARIVHVLSTISACCRISGRQTAEKGHLKARARGYKRALDPRQGGSDHRSRKTPKGQGAIGEHHTVLPGSNRGSDYTRSHRIQTSIWRDDGRQARPVNEQVARMTMEARPPFSVRLKRVCELAAVEHCCWRARWRCAHPHRKKGSSRLGISARC